jgi:hypothetical protein
MTCRFRFGRSLGSSSRLGTTTSLFVTDTANFGSRSDSSLDVDRFGDTNGEETQQRLVETNTPLDFRHL